MSFVRWREIVESVKPILFIALILWGAFGLYQAATLLRLTLSTRVTGTIDHFQKHLNFTYDGQKYSRALSKEHFSSDGLQVCINKTSPAASKPFDLISEVINMGLVICSFLVFLGLYKLAHKLQRL